jgi:short-subunit dehydrogenase
MVNWYRRTMLAERTPRAILITGGSAGIGRAAALMFAAMGDHVAVVARRTDLLEALAQEAEREKLPGRILPLTADVTDPAAMQRAVALALAEFNRLDVLVAGAGVGHRGALADAAWRDLETVLRTNMDGVLHSIRAAVPAMRASGGGQIVLLSSVLGPVPAPYAAAYSASKAALEALARSLRGELHADRIHVTVLRIGQTDTEFAEKRLGQPGRVATRWPTMSPEQVAGAIGRALERNPRVLSVRWIDSAFIWLGQRFPALMDRILRRIYD